MVMVVERQKASADHSSLRRLCTLLAEPRVTSETQRDEARLPSFLDQTLKSSATLPLLLHKARQETFLIPQPSPVRCVMCDEGSKGLEDRAI